MKHLDHSSFVTKFMTAWSQRVYFRLFYLQARVQVVCLNITRGNIVHIH